MESLDSEAKDTWCRVCLSQPKGDLIPLNYEVEGVSVGSLITACSGVQIPEEDSFPRNCCEECAEALFNAYSIAKLCRESDEKLRALSGSGTEDLTRKDEVEKEDAYSSDHEDSVSVREENAASMEAGEESGDDEQASVTTVCCACRIDFETGTALAEHIAKVHEPEQTTNASKKPYQCEVCFKRYFKKTSLNRHKRMGSVGSKVLQEKEQQPVDARCCGCRKDFNSAEDLKEHSKAEHLASRVCVDETRPYECEICFKRYSNRASLSRHFRERFAEKQGRTIRKLAANQCCGCREKFPTKEQLAEHSKQIHEPDRQNDLEGLKPFECGICFSRYSSREAFNRHKVFAQMDQLYQCQQCDKSFVKRIMLRFHERKFHNGVQQDVVGPHQCSRCGKTFMQPSSLINHERIHDQSERFECTICQKTYCSKGNLQTHFKLHTEPVQEREPQYECPICRCRFKTPGYLEVHARVHTGEKPFQCKFCSKQFAHASGHKRHLLTHSSLKPFVCRFCNRTFSNRPNMLIHEKSHGSERNVKCDICEKEFVHERYMKKHRTRHFSFEEK